PGTRRAQLGAWRNPRGAFPPFVRTAKPNVAQRELRILVIAIRRLEVLGAVQERAAAQHTFRTAFDLGALLAFCGIFAKVVERPFPGRARQIELTEAGHGPLVFPRRRERESATRTTQPRQHSRPVLAMRCKRVRADSVTRP